MVSVVHAVSHLGECVARCGPMSNWNTFSFESIVGMRIPIILYKIIFFLWIGSFSRNINSATVIGTELGNSLELLHQAWLAVGSASFSAEGKLFMKQLFASNRQAMPSSFTPELNEQSIRLRHKIVVMSDSHQILAQKLKQVSYNLYNTAFINNIRFSNEAYTKNKCVNDSCILYKMSNSPIYSVGFLKCIVQLSANNCVLFLVQQVSIQSYADELKIGNRNYRCNNVMYGNATLPTTYHLIRSSNIIEKLAFQPESSQSKTGTMPYFFFRYPNFRTST